VTCRALDTCAFRGTQYLIIAGLLNAQILAADVAQRRYTGVALQPLRPASTANWNGPRRRGDRPARGDWAHVASDTVASVLNARPTPYARRGRDDPDGPCRQAVYRQLNERIYLFNTLAPAALLIRLTFRLCSGRGDPPSVIEWSVAL